MTGANPLGVKFSATHFLLESEGFGGKFGRKVNKVFAVECRLECFFRNQLLLTVLFRSSVKGTE